MSDVILYKRCDCLDGQKEQWLGSSEEGGDVVEETTCAECEGTGKVLWGYLDGELLDTVIAELDYIHGKVTAIWNQVKPGA